MRGGSNGRGNFTFMQAIPSGLDTRPSPVLQQATGSTGRKEDP